MAADIQSIRRENLRKLIDAWGGATVLAKRLGRKNSSFFAQMLGDPASKHTRRVSEYTVREIEEKLGLLPGVMDRPSADFQASHPTAPIRALPPPPGVSDTLHQCMDAIDRVCERTGAMLKTSLFNEVLASTFELVNAGVPLNDTIVEQLVKLALRCEVKVASFR